MPAVAAPDWKSCSKTWSTSYTHTQVRGLENEKDYPYVDGLGVSDHSIVSSRGTSKCSVGDVGSVGTAALGCATLDAGFGGDGGCTAALGGGCGCDEDMSD